MDQAWRTIEELASLGLPGLPIDPSELQRRAALEGWQSWQGLGGQPLARKREGSGEWEYHVVGLPQDAFYAAIGAEVVPGPLQLDRCASHAVSIGWTTHEVLCEWPDGYRGAPVSVAVQDTYSRKFLTIRHGKAPAIELMLAALIDVMQDYGVPRYVLTADRWCQAMPEDFTSLMAFDSSVKPLPINRAWRTFREWLDRSAEMDGAFIGRNLKAKRAVAFDYFGQIAWRELLQHNSHEGRVSPAYLQGASFDEAFRDSYQQSVVGKMRPGDLEELASRWALPRVS